MNKKNEYVQLLKTASKELYKYISNELQKYPNKGKAEDVFDKDFEAKLETEKDPQQNVSRYWELLTAYTLLKSSAEIRFIKKIDKSGTSYPDFIVEMDDVIFGIECTVAREGKCPEMLRKLDEIERILISNSASFSSSEKTELECSPFLKRELNERLISVCSDKIKKTGKYVESIRKLVDVDVDKEIKIILSVAFDIRAQFSAMLHSPHLWFESIYGLGDYCVDVTSVKTFYNGNKKTQAKIKNNAILNLNLIEGHANLEAISLSEWSIQSSLKEHGLLSAPNAEKLAHIMPYSYLYLKSNDYKENLKKLFTGIDIFHRPEEEVLEKLAQEEME